MKRKAKTMIVMARRRKAQHTKDMAKATMKHPTAEAITKPKRAPTAEATIKQCVLCGSFEEAGNSRKETETPGRKQKALRKEAGKPPTKKGATKEVSEASSGQK